MGKSGSIQTLKIGSVEFRDTFKFFASSLDALAQTKTDEENKEILDHIEQMLNNHEKFSSVLKHAES